MTLSQVFQIGAALIAFFTAIMPQFGIDPKTVALVGGALGTLWGTIGGIMTNSTAQAQSTAARIDDPAVKSLLVPAVANLPGIAGAGPIKVDTTKADATLANMANSNDPRFSNIEKK